MIDYKIITFVTAFAALWFVLHYIDSKYGLSIAKCFGGQSDTPFSLKSGDNNTLFDAFCSQTEASDAQQSVYLEESENKALKAEIHNLKARIQVLEKIVTEPAYELNKELSKL